MRAAVSAAFPGNLAGGLLLALDGTGALEAGALSRDCRGLLAGGLLHSQFDVRTMK